MVKRPTRKARRFKHDVNHDPLRDLVYRREAWVFRRAYHWWATADEMHRLNTALARRFSVPIPKLILRLSRSRQTATGHFTDPRNPRIWVRGYLPASRWQRWESWAVNNKCENVQITGFVQPGQYLVHTLLHEFAHYLGFIWTGNGRHDALFCSLDEITHEWYASQPKRGRVTKRAVLVRPVKD